MPYWAGGDQISVWISEAGKSTPMRDAKVTRGKQNARLDCTRASFKNGLLRHESDDVTMLGGCFGAAVTRPSLASTR